MRSRCDLSRRRRPFSTARFFQAIAASPEQAAFDGSWKPEDFEQRV
jgi:hypothetical protein